MFCVEVLYDLFNLLEIRVLFDLCNFTMHVVFFLPGKNAIVFLLNAYWIIQYRRLSISYEAVMVS